MCEPGAKNTACAPSNDGGTLYNEAPQHKAGECCYKIPRRVCGGGRPLRSDDGPILAALTSRSDWTIGDVARIPAEGDEELAARWLREASFEHASVASFARVTLQLMALGAPPELIEGTQRAALDEIEHAKTFLALAARRGAGERGPGPLAVDRAPLATTFEAFVVETFLDGCLAETVSGIEIRTRAEDGDDVEREALSRIADEEERHAELAWRMLAWGVRAGGRAARTALEETVRRIEDESPVVRWVVLPCVRALLDEKSLGGAIPDSESGTSDFSRS